MVTQLHPDTYLAPRLELTVEEINALLEKEREILQGLSEAGKRFATLFILISEMAAEHNRRQISLTTLAKQGHGK